MEETKVENQQRNSGLSLIWTEFESGLNLKTLFSTQIKIITIKKQTNTETTEDLTSVETFN